MITLLALVLADALAAQAAFYLGAELYSAVVSGAFWGFGLSPQLAVMALSLPIGYLLLDVYRVPGQAPIERFPLRILGSIADSARYSRRVETAIVTTPSRSVDAVAMEFGYRDIIIVPDLRELPTLWVRARDLNGLIGLQMWRNLLLRRNRLLKQTIDYLVALPLAMVSAPIRSTCAFSRCVRA
jgi:hypothetical protein